MILYRFKSNNVDRFEDFCRSIFGDKAFLVFCVEKMLSGMNKVLGNILKDELARSLLEKYIHVREEVLNPKSSSPFILRKEIFKSD